MTVYESITLMLSFGTLLVSLISLTVAIALAIFKDNTKNKHPAFDRVGVYLNIR